MDTYLFTVFLEKKIGNLSSFQAKGRGAPMFTKFQSFNVSNLGKVDTNSEDVVWRINGYQNFRGSLVVSLRVGRGKDGSGSSIGNIITTPGIRAHSINDYQTSHGQCLKSR